MWISPPREAEIPLKNGGDTLHATLSWPEGAQAVVLFAHGSGSSRFSPRNRRVAAGLQSAGLATVLLDLLTPGEEVLDQTTQQHRFDIPMLAARLTEAVDWVIRGRKDTPSIGLFGASTGAAAALRTAALRPEAIQAIVCRGGRPDLALQMLPRVRCPTLLIVGGADQAVLALNQEALAAMTAPRHLALVPGATHLFEEPGALEQVTTLAKDWFCDHLLHR